MAPFPADEDKTRPLAKEDAPDSLPGDIEAKRDAMRAEHDKQFLELTPDPSVPEEAPSLSPEHDEALAETRVQPTLLGEQFTQAAQPNRATPQPTPQKPRGRYQVPSSERTPGNRAERRAEHRAEHERWMQAGQEPTLQGFFEQGGRAEDAPDGAGNGDIASALRGVLNADHSLSGKFAEILSEHEQKLNAILRFIEQGRV